MEFLDGMTLRALLQRGAKLSVARIVEIMTQVCAGVAHASARGIVHRDLRPDNVMLVPGHDDEGRLTEVVKVLDFGIAPVRGAPEYMSPEQCRNEPLDERSNVYVCGLLLYELATGKVPFTADKPITVVNRQLSMTPPSIEEARPDLDPRLDAVVQRALKKAKDDRQASIKELRAELKKLLVPADSITRPTPPPTSHQPASEPAISIPPPAPAPVVLEAMPVAYEAPQAKDIAAPQSQPSVQLDAPTDPPPPPPPPPPAAPASKPSNKLPDWLEDRSAHYSAFLDGASAGTGGEDLLDILQRDPKPWLAKFVQERDPRQFATQVNALDRAVRVLALQADAKALWAVSSAVNGLVTHGSSAGPNTRAARAAKLIQLFTDPGMLGPIAERVLATDDDAREAGRTLLIRARTAGAYAVYGARVKHAASSGVRAPFVTTMQEIGTHAWPVIRAALEKIPPAALTGGHPLASDLAEDLLLSVPNVRDEAAGHLVATFVRSTVPSLCSAATRALARLWADRARPLLLGLLGNPDEAVRLAAVAGLREMGAVDEHVARRLAPIVAPGAPISGELRTQALAALGSMTEDAKPVAVPILVKVVRDPGASDDATVLSAARALIAVMGREAISVVHDRAERSSEPLRSELRRLVRSGTASI
jgi:serine/threonine-protein kinase